MGCYSYNNARHKELTVRNPTLTLTPYLAIVAHSYSGQESVGSWLE